MKALFYGLTCLLCIGAMSCEKEHAPKTLATFNHVYSNGPVTFNLVPGAVTQIVSTSMMESYYSVSGDQLSINGLGSMTISVKDLRSFTCQSCTITGSDIVTDTMVFSLTAGTMRLDNIRVSGAIQVSATGTGSVKLSGSVPWAIALLEGMTEYYTYGLTTDSTYMTSGTIATTEVYATKVLNVFINSIGSIKYKGDPLIVRKSGTGSGTLIRQ